MDSELSGAWVGPAFLIFSTSASTAIDHVTDNCRRYKRQVGQVK